MEPELTIGDIARRAGVATSAVRFYERRGLLCADHRQSGQRRYRVTTLRRLIFIGMLQDAGLSLDDIAGILGAERVEDWKAIGRRRLVALDAEIERLQRARTPTSTAPSSAATTIRRPTARSWAERSTGVSTARTTDSAA